MPKLTQIIKQAVVPSTTRYQPAISTVDHGLEACIVSETIPGKRGIAALKRYGDLSPHMAVTTRVMPDMTNSLGNYLADIDGNRYLDMFSQISSLILGYNHPEMIKTIRSKKAQTLVVNRPALGYFPPSDFPDLLQESVLRCAPPGMDHVTTMMCGSTSNENAFKCCFKTFMNRERGGENPDQAELLRCNENDGVGNKLSIMGFRGAFHGRTFGCISATCTRGNIKSDIPTLDFPFADFPQLKYPLEDNIAENKAEESRCLDRVRSIIHRRRAARRPVAGCIVEPIQAEGGDTHASNDFFRKLRQLLLDEQVYFIVDEVQTGGGVSGKWWAHEHWNLETPPDIVTFAKKNQSAGFYYGRHMANNWGPTIFNTWVGDPLQLLKLRTVLNVAEQEGLTENAKHVGDYVYNELSMMQGDFDLNNVRGKGTLVAWDHHSTEMRDKVIGAAMTKGLLLGGCGTHSIRLRPSLMFEYRHADQFLDLLAQTLKSV